MQTAFIWGRLVRAGDTGWRARCGFRGLRRTCINVAFGTGVAEKDRIVLPRNGSGWGRFMAEVRDVNEVRRRGHKKGRRRKDIAV